MRLQVAAGSGDDQPETVPATMQNLARVQQVTQALVDLDAAEKQKRTGLAARNIVVVTFSTEDADGDRIDPVCKTPIAFFNFGLGSRPKDDQPVCLIA